MTGERETWWPSLSFGCHNGCCQAYDGVDAVDGMLDIGHVSEDVRSTGISQVYTVTSQPPHPQSLEAKGTNGIDKMELVQDRDIGGGVIYRGQWKGKCCHGVGILKKPDGSCFEGAFQEGKAHGYGKFRGADGFAYEGEWKDDRVHGEGKCSFPDGSCYKGQWHYDQKSGNGVEQFPDGSHYTGEFIGDGKHGKGEFVSSSGELLYDGQFVDDAMHGVGRYVFSDGRNYKGQWRAGVMSGNGVLQWPDGSRHEGEFADNMRHGVGSFISPKGEVDRGQWNSDKKEEDVIL